MAVEFDAFSIQLLDEAKRFLERAGEAEEPGAFLHAALLLAFSSLESHLNGVAAELALRQDESLLDRAILLERGLRFRGGEWQLTTATEFYRLEDRIKYLFHRYADRKAKTEPWWHNFKEAITARNGLVHPREVVNLTAEEVERFVTSIVEALNALYLVIFSKGHPSHGRGLQSTLSF